jgi:CTP:molybdopterin cytidylyltransferase MocA
MAHSVRKVVVIPAAGISARFGVGVTKAALPVGWRGAVRPMLHHVLSHLPQDFRVVIGTTRSQMPVFENLVATRPAPPTVDVVSVGEATNGQADTIHRILEFVDPMSSCIVVNCDNVFMVDLRILTMTLDLHEAAMFVHQSNNPACSYVNQIPNPTRFEEKIPISEWALSGAWAFRSSRHLQDILWGHLRQGERTNGEFYLSTALNRMGGSKLAIAIGRDQVLDWGTPETLAASGAVLMERAA